MVTSLGNSNPYPLPPVCRMTASIDDLLKRLSEDQNWTFTEIRPDGIVGFAPGSNVMTICHVHDVGARGEADNAIRSNLSEGPVLVFREPLGYGLEFPKEVTIQPPLHEKMPRIPSPWRENVFY
jgi:hypothetical protein